MESYRIKADGACMFRSVAFGLRLHGWNGINNDDILNSLSISNILRKNTNDAINLRKYVVNILYNKWDDNGYSNFILKNPTRNQYVKYMLKQKTYGTHIELQKLNDYVKKQGLKGIKIYVHNNITNRFNLYVDFSETNNNKNNTSYIKLHFEPEIHYNYLANFKEHSNMKDKIIKDKLLYNYAMKSKSKMSKTNDKVIQKKRLLHILKNYKITSNCILNNDIRWCYK